MKREEIFKQRLIAFSIGIIKLCRDIKHSVEIVPVISQIVRSSTSVGANYTEAINAISEKEFRSKIYICKKEAEETKYWLDILKQSLPEEEKCRELAQEIKELCLIFQKITYTINTKSKNSE